MKIFGLGLAKTGTTSLTEALRVLGFDAIHYPNDPVTYSQILNGDFDFNFLRQFDAATDTAIVRYYAELDRIYPGSKFIYTLRDIPSWLESCQRHWARVEPSIDKVNFRTVTDVSVYGCARFNRERFKFVYEQHEREVKRYFAGRCDDLLEFDVVGGDGWEPLCSFLGYPIPDIPFPHLHLTSKRKVSGGAV